MKKTKKLCLSGLFMLLIFLALPQNIKALQTEDVQEEIESDLELKKVVLKVEDYTKEYLEALNANMFEEEVEVLSLKDYLIKKLKEDYFTEEEIFEAFKKVKEIRKEKVVKLAQNSIEADEYLSKNRLISILEAEHFSKEEVSYVVDHVEINWDEQSKKAAEKYIDENIKFEDKAYQIFSKKCLIRYLVEEKEFTLEEATTGVEEAGIDWAEQAFKQAKYYLESDAYSRVELIEKLISDGFTSEEAVHGVNKTGTDWKEQAAKKAVAYLNNSLSKSIKELIKYLRGEGFTPEEAFYGAERALAGEEAEEDEMEVERLEPSVPEKPVISKPVEFVSSQLVIEVPSSNDFQEKKPSSKIKQHVTETEEMEELDEEIEEASLFDDPIFAPIIMVLILGNLYMYQKM